MGDSNVGADRFTIGALSRATGLRPSALRYYESVGLLPAPPRIRGQRRYDPAVLETLRLVELAQSAGFTIAEIRQLMSGFTSGTPASKRWQALARRKREEVVRQIERAQEMKQMLDALLECRCAQLADCVTECDPRPVQLISAR